MQHPTLCQRQSGGRGGDVAKNPDVQVRFGKRLRAIREGKGVSQEKLAEDAGLHRTYVSAVERGLKNISLVNIERLAQALGVEMADLVRFGDASARSGEAQGTRGALQARSIDAETKRGQAGSLHKTPPGRCSWHPPCTFALWMCSSTLREHRPDVPGGGRTAVISSPATAARSCRSWT